MIKQILFLAIFLLIFSGCEELYNPKIDDTPELLVIEAHLTNEPTQNFVKLTMTRNFNSTDAVVPAVGAKVSLNEADGETINGIEGNPGYFTFAKTPVPGKIYLLRIQYKEDDYESDQVKMPPLPTIDTIYTPWTIEKNASVDIFGKPQLNEIPGRNISIDAPISDDLKYYRFKARAILEWQYVAPEPLAPTWYGWLSLHTTSFNLAGPKDFSVSGKIQNHKILFLANNTHMYLDSIEQSAIGWILILEEYGITKESNDFHEQLNQQFSADGSLFDPVTTQIYSNIHCTNDQSKIVLGFFDLNSYRQHRYFFRLSEAEEWCIQRKLNRYPDIPENGYVVGTRPSFWETAY